MWACFVVRNSLSIAAWKSRVKVELNDEMTIDELIKEYQDDLDGFYPQVPTLAVRNGDLIQFNSAVVEYSTLFKADKNEAYSQVLGHNVLKTGLRKISTSYSRISLQDIADKLHLASAQAAEYICAKAIRDGVIEASIDHSAGHLTSREVSDLYSTEEPQNAFH
eukprot:gene41265-51086_t